MVLLLAASEYRFDRVGVFTVRAAGLTRGFVTEGRDEDANGYAELAHRSGFTVVFRAEPYRARPASARGLIVTKAGGPAADGSPRAVRAQGTQPRGLFA